ncbi:MAG TPA: aminotransferase class V-fold PLP-dependent enzyme [Micromonosporaceae bacterium]|nr:aminotransferase class V-fold PLP-dependent enzyme [Micromonosporaceae bacterium]
MSDGYYGCRVGAYLDSATASPLHPVARQALLAALDDGWADPGRLYTRSRRARQLADAARGAVAEALGVRDDEVSFPASGSDAVYRAIAGTLAGRGGSGGPGRPGGRVVHSAVEHSAVLRAAALGPAQAVAVDRLGRVDLDAFAAAVRAPDVTVAALQSANHEVGTVQPVAAAAELAAEAGVPLLVDAAQSVGRMAVPPGWALLTASARKWGGPPGVGVLVVRKGTRYLDPEPQAGPVSLPAVVAAAASLRAVLADAAAEAVRLRRLVARLRDTVAATVPDVEVVGDADDRLPHLVTFSCLYVDGEALVHALDRHGYAVSSGSACTADTLRPSHVLAAMGVLTHGNVRVSLHSGVTEADVDDFLAVLPGVVAQLRAEAGVAGL